MSCCKEQARNVLLKSCHDMKTCKCMEKSFCIKPANDEMAVYVHAVFLLNEFKKLFETRRGFIQIMVDKLPKYDNPKGYDQLTAFWNSRMKNDAMNNDVEFVLEQLKSE